MVKKARHRDPIRTRRAILDAAYVEVRRHGFRKLKTDRVLDAVGLTKGALYHHFHNKQALGCALIEEWVGPDLFEQWVEPIERAADPVEALARLLERWARETKKGDLVEGGAFTRLADELGAEGEAYASRLARIQTEWRERWVRAFANAAREGRLRRSVDPERTAALVIACVQGLEVAGRIAPTKAFWRTGVEALVHWVRSGSHASKGTKPPASPPGTRPAGSPDSRVKDEPVVVYRIGGVESQRDEMPDGGITEV